jgi:hypothetical protein
MINVTYKSSFFVISTQSNIYKDMEVAKKWEVWTNEKKAREERGQGLGFVGDVKGYLVGQVWLTKMVG